MLCKVTDTVAILNGSLFAQIFMSCYCYIRFLINAFLSEIYISVLLTLFDSTHAVNYRMISFTSV